MMKIKQTLYISDQETFLKGNYGQSISIIGGDWMNGTWTNCGVIEIDVDIDTQTVIEHATEKLNIEIGKHAAALHILEQRKAELLCLTDES